MNNVVRGSGNIGVKLIALMQNAYSVLASCHPDDAARRTEDGDGLSSSRRRINSVRVRPLADNSPRRVRQVRTVAAGPRNAANTSVRYLGYFRGCYSRYTLLAVVTFAEYPANLTLMLPWLDRIHRRCLGEAKGWLEGYLCERQ